MRRIDKAEAAIGTAQAAVSEAAVLFERRWTVRALRRVAPEIAARMDTQRARFGKACLDGEAEDIERHGAALCRGWAACVAAMEAASEEDDSYLSGWDARTGFRVAIAHQKAAADRVAELHGQRVCFVTPDEIASILAGLESFKAVAIVKQFFPGAEVLDRYPDEPAKGDG